jgi:dienelactone hydrolase
MPPILRAYLYMPAGQSPPYPVVVIMPSSGGLRDDIEHYYARQLSAQNIATLVIDSFGTRGVKDVIPDQSRVNFIDMEADAYAAHAWLQNDTRFHKDRIGVMGVSKGGGVAQYLALNIRRRWWGTEDFRFAAFAPIVPACDIRHRSLHTDGRPMFFMLAERDDENAAAKCEEYAAQIRSAGNVNVKIKTYRNAYHAWEVLGPVRYSPQAEQFSRCHVTLEDDGKYLVPGISQRMSGQEWVAYAKKTCVHRGRHFGGGTESLKLQATQDLIEFFQKAGFVP